MISELIKIGENWRNPNYLLRQEAIDKAAYEFRLSPASFSLALDWIFSFWNEKIISVLYETNPYFHISNAIQVLAGNTPAVIAQAFLQGAILGVPQIIKSSSSQSIFPQLMLISFQEVSETLGKLFYVDHWKNKLTEFYTEISKSDLIIAYGSDETMMTLKSYCSSTNIFIERGHAVSGAIIFKDAANIESLNQLAWDMLSYDQRGCLSPRVTFVEEGGELSPYQCAEIFSKEILPSMAEQFPSGGLFPGESIAIMQRRSVYGFRGIVYQGNDWTVCYDEKLIWPEENLPRFMPFKPFVDSNILQKILQPTKQHLISMGIAGNGEMEWDVYPKLQHLCKLGNMQKQFLL